MRFYIFSLLVVGSLTCNRESKGSQETKLSCFAQDVAEGVELVCDGVPHLIKNGKEGPAGPAGRSGSPGPKGDAGPPGASGRSIANSQVCSLTWEGSPEYKMDFLIFTYSDGIKEATAIVEAGNGDLETNSSIWLAADSRFATAPTDVGGFFFTQTGNSAVVLFRTTGRTDTMSCH